ncbi:hypothetical protein QJS04_geneDACA009448 [Acorus gramineus]|uniref:cysteine dioxygenase n=1 Tax=Acorus gramineus TaxID=55184 RepID=A0AAV9AH61_ACOGR|nr:hypothetical protein QJS04_geneDACA009448 [Acorus gramineus]
MLPFPSLMPRLKRPTSEFALSALIVIWGPLFRMISRSGSVVEEGLLMDSSNDGESAIRRRSRRKSKRPFPAPSVTALQRLFSTCEGVFKGPGTVPHPHEVQALQLILDRMKPEDVGLSRDLLVMDRNAVEGTPTITYTTIYQCKNFSVDSVFTAPCDTSVLYPTQGGNIHTFTARTACAVLDILGPPYSKEDGRDCTYYKDFPYAAHPDVGASDTETKERDAMYGWLEEVDMPSELKMDFVEYLGPKIKF